MLPNVLLYTNVFKQHNMIITTTICIWHSSLQYTSNYADILLSLSQQQKHEENITDTIFSNIKSSCRYVYLQVSMS